VKGDVTADNNKTQRIIRDFGNLYPNKLENLKERDNFLDTYDLPTLNQEDKNNTLINKTEAAIVIQQRKI
jgi:hypothetical protein